MSYYNGGGNTGDVSGNIGFEPIDGAYFNLTAEVRNHGHSDQGAIDERVINPAELSSYLNSNMPQVANYPYLNMISGDGESHTKLVSFNSGFNFGGGVEFYAFGTYGDKKAQSYENYRLPNKVSFTNPVTGVTTYPFPFGFNPLEAARETDYSLTGGFKGVVADWNWDVASSYGSDKVKIYTLDSANAAIYAGGLLSLQNFYDGLLQTTQSTTHR